MKKGVNHHVRKPTTVMKMNDRLTARGIWAVARREIVSRKRTQLLRVTMMLSVLVIAVVAILWFTNQIYKEDLTGNDQLADARVIEDACNAVLFSVAMVFYILFGLFGMLSASAMFSELSDKQRRIHFLTIPEYTADKYTGRFLVYGPLFAVVFMVCAVIALAVGWMFSQLLYAPLFDSDDLLRNPFDVLFGFSRPFMYLIPIVLLTVSVSFYTVGSVAFPRLTFIKTFVVLFVAQTILQIFLPVAYLIFSRFNHEIIEGIPTDEGIFALVVILSVMLMLLTVFNWVMGYVWLRKTDIAE